MAQEKVSRQELRDLRIGRPTIFTLIKPKKISSVRVSCAQLKLEEGLEFRVIADYRNSSVCVTRLK